jgi:hypothetical protein
MWLLARQTGFLHARFLPVYNRSSSAGGEIVPYVDSSAVSFLYYDEVAAELHVAFTGGRSYVYYGVPRRVYDGLLAAPSVGAYFNAQIRDRYRFRRSVSPPSRISARGSG